jgi:hypothetical protein
MTDAFDALRVADAERQEWIKAARVFTRLLDRVVDPNTVRNLERWWDEASTMPLAPASKAWELVDEACDAVGEDMPLTFEEVARHGDLTIGDVLDETRRWQEARRRRDEEVEIEVERTILRILRK